MRKKLNLAGIIVCFLMSIGVAAQTKINASDIINDIRNGKNITYKNATIVGVLDFTFMNEKVDKLPKRKSSWWGNNSNSNKIVEKIKGKVSFENCTFEDHVFAYIHDEDSGYTFTADFNDDAIFKNCNFNEMALFKYSIFDEKADFSDTKFKGESSFKYAEFKNYTNFSNTFFEETSTFKYSIFSNSVSFSNSKFKETATFKYAKFKDGVSFKNTRFEHDLIIKYTKISGDFDVSGMHVEYEIDSKYSNINGKKFSFNNVAKN